MKKFIVPLLLSLASLFVLPSYSYKAAAQITRAVTIPTVDTLLTNADTAAVVLTFDGSFKSVEAWVEEVTGTTGGKVSFQGKLPHNGVSVGTDWATIDSFSLSDIAEDQYKLFTVPTVRTYAAYRILFVKASTGTARIKAWYVRYTGGAILRPDPYQGFAFLSFRPYTFLAANKITDRIRFSLKPRNLLQRS